MAWLKLPEELFELDLPYSAMILAAILYDADRKSTQRIVVKQRVIAEKMHADVNTILRGIRHLEKAGIILSHKSIGDATVITLKADVLPPKKSGGQASRSTPKPAQQLANSSIDLTEAEKLINDFSSGG